MNNIVRIKETSLPSTCFVFKNSTTCPVSARAADVVRNANSDTPIYWIDVIEQRPISNWVSETYKVKHESPQLLLINNSQVVQVWNHGRISGECFAGS
ncbi:MAG: bacillithiol system redox-active protein YtxJ [bacterium]|nr:bacillithiol system redox-active protein YtxJ [bacterium]